MKCMANRKVSKNELISILISYCTAASIEIIFKEFGFSNDMAVELLGSISNYFSLIKTPLVDIDDFDLDKNFNIKSSFLNIKQIDKGAANYIKSYVQIIAYSLIEDFGCSVSDAEKYIKMLDTYIYNYCNGRDAISLVSDRLNNNFNFSLKFKN